MKRGDGIITAGDLADYAPKWREPITFARTAGTRSISMPPPSSGGLALALIAGQLEPYDLAGARLAHGEGRPPHRRERCGAHTPSATRCSAIPTS